MATTLLPFLAVAVAIAALLIQKPDQETEPNTEWIPAALFALLAVLAGFFLKDRFHNALPSGIGLALGAVIAMAAAVLDSRRTAAAAIAIATAAAAFCHYAGDEVRLAIQLGVGAGLGFGAWLSGARTLAIGVGLAGAIIIGADVMGAHATDTLPGPHAGDAFGLAASVAALVVLAIHRFGKPNAFGPLIGLALLAGLGYVVGGRYLDVADTWMIFIGSILVAGVVAMLVPSDGEVDSMRHLLAAVIWVGVATAAFGLRKGFGITVSLVGASSTLLILGNMRALLTMGPLLALGMYRVFRESFPDATRALDIGQHYALIGLLVGSLVPLLPVDWQLKLSRDAGIRGNIARVVWVIVLMLLPAGVAILLGAKGVVGLVAGVGLAGLLQSIRGSQSAAPLLLATGVAGLTTVSYGWMRDVIDLTREEKQQALLTIFVVGILLAGGLALLTPRRTVAVQEAS